MNVYNILSWTIVFGISFIALQTNEIFFSILHTISTYKISFSTLTTCCIWKRQSYQTLFKLILKKLRLLYSWYYPRLKDHTCYEHNFCLLFASSCAVHLNDYWSENWGSLCNLNHQSINEDGTKLKTVLIINLGYITIIV